MSDSKKEAEAQELMKSAKKHASKSITKWNADYDAAATDYEKAAKIFAHLRKLPEAREAFNAASEAHTKAKNGFFAAKSIEQLATLLKDDDAYVQTEAGMKEISELYIRASTMYALDNKPERQAEAMLKAARITPVSEAKNAAKKMHQALDAFEDNDKFHYTPDVYRALVLIELRGNLLADAIATLKRAMKAFEKLNQAGAAAKAGLEIVILALALGDFVLADREFRDLQAAFGFAHSSEQGAAYGLISAIDERDEDGLKDALKHQALQFIVPDISRIAKKLKISGVANVPAKRAPGASGGAPAAGRVVSSAPPPQEDDEEDLR